MTSTEPFSSVPPSVTHRGASGNIGGLSDFFHFRTLITTGVIRGIFLVATAAIVLGLVGMPIAYFVERGGQTAALEREVSVLQDYMRRSQPTVDELMRSHNEATRLANSPDHTIAYREAQVRVDQLRTTLKEMSPVPEISDPVAALARVDALKQRIKDSAGVGANSAQRTLLGMLGLMLAWIVLRLILEGTIVLFSIHEMMAEAVSHRRG